MSGKGRIWRFGSGPPLPQLWDGVRPMYRARAAAALPEACRHVPCLVLRLATPLRQVPLGENNEQRSNKIAVTPPRGESAMDLELQGKHAIVTGGSRGIGKSLRGNWLAKGSMWRSWRRSEER